MAPEMPIYRILADEQDGKIGQVALDPEEVIDDEKNNVKLPKKYQAKVAPMTILEYYMMRNKLWIEKHDDFTLVTIFRNVDSSGYRVDVNSEAFKMIDTETNDTYKCRGIYGSNDKHIAYELINHNLGTINMQGGFGRLYRTKKATYLSIDYFQPKDKWFYFFNSGDRLIDEATGDEYWIRKAENIPMDTCCFVQGAKNRYIRFVLVFPPLPKKVKEVKYFSPSAPSRDTFTGLATREGPFEVEKMRKKRTPGSSVKPRIIE